MATIRLRRFRMTDIDALYQAVVESHRELIPWMAWCHEHYGIDDARAWVESRDQAWNDQVELAFVMDDPAGTFLGTCGLNRFDLMNRTANLGYWVRTSMAGQGIATRAVRQLVELAFQTTQLNRLELLIAVANVPSCRVAAKVGATCEGRLRERIWCNGRFQDARVFSILRADWS